MGSPFNTLSSGGTRAVGLVLDHQGEHSSQWEVMVSIAWRIGCAAETLRRWLRHAARRVDPARRSARARRDAMLGIETRRVFDANFGVYGARKEWRQLLREGRDVVRCTVARLMRELGLQGVIRGKPVRTTVIDKKAACPSDHINRQFPAPAPNRLWVSDFTYVAT